MLLGERRGGTKYEVCPRCHQPTTLTLDHGTNQWVHVGCPGDERGRP